jgi:hypothetical protein
VDNGGVARRLAGVHGLSGLAPVSTSVPQKKQGGSQMGKKTDKSADKPKVKKSPAKPKKKKEK